MKKLNSIITLIALLLISCSLDYKNNTEVDHDNVMVRIAEIEIEAEHLEEYLAILKKEAEASVRLESGVICIYPMYQKENPTQIRLLEIYSNKEAYESHLQTPHFKHYKTTTLPMVKDLRLVEMEALNSETIPMIFTKLNKK
ncbi:MAG: putative quinol monooxygenase [Allomuricauda sp.]